MRRVTTEARLDTHQGLGAAKGPVPSASRYSVSRALLLEKSAIDIIVYRFGRVEAHLKGYL
jgi:hypothetical protein